MTESWREQELADGASTWDDVVDVVRRQHAELGEELLRISALTGSARLDVSLLIRRRLAVHEALEHVLVGPVTADPPGGLRPIVEAIEGAEADGDDADVAAAWVRARAAFLQHVEASVAPSNGYLSAPQRAVLGEAVRLWEGRADAYLGHEYDVMLNVALQQLSEAAADA
ncbi:MAG TPA: hypothetical protein VFY88_12120 [Intrasporangium sp.]|nr:hypothetical protein [Intrasporangium sp.]